MLIEYKTSSVHSEEISLVFLLSVVSAKSRAILNFQYTNNYKAIHWIIAILVAVKYYQITFNCLGTVMNQQLNLRSIQPITFQCVYTISNWVIRL